MSSPCRQTRLSRAMRAALLISLGLLQGAPASAKGFETVAVLPPSASPSYLPISGLAADAQGRLYGTSADGGAFGYGYVYRITKGVLTSDPWTFETLHSFNSADGAYPEGSLTIGSAGEIYGTASEGGTYGYGTAFRLDNLPGWPLTTLHSFGAKGDVGAIPRGSLVFGLNGLLYGTTYYSYRDERGGAVFSLSPLGDTVNYTIIHPFHPPEKATGGFYPNGDLVAARNGDIYGTTAAGGATQSSIGTFFKLSLTDTGVWRHTILHDFALGSGDYLPTSAVRAADGTFYGCASNASGVGGLQGSVYAITPPAKGNQIWSESTVYIFASSEVGTNTGCEAVAVNPEGGLIVTNVTSMYNSGQQTVEGIIVQLLPPPMVGAAWTATTIHDFGVSPLSDPIYPTSSLLRQGRLYYGVTIPNNQGLNDGTVYHARP